MSRPQLQATRVGDVERVRYLLEHDFVDVNTRDRWDSVPLYYACLAGVSSYDRNVRSPQMHKSYALMCRIE